MNLFTAYPFFWPALQHNLIWLAVFLFIATPIGIFFAVLLDREIRGTPDLPERVLPAGRPVAGDRRVHLGAACTRPSRGSSTTSSAAPRNDNLIDWLGDPSLNLWAVLVAASWRHVGYIMVLYLAGLKSVDPTLREAAAIDGANERQTFFRVVFPVMRPINIVDHRDHGRSSRSAPSTSCTSSTSGQNGLELLSMLITNNSISESSRVGFGSAIAVVLLVISLVPDRHRS